MIGEEGPHPMALPITALIAVPLLYAAWQRRKSRREALADPTAHLSPAAKQAMRRKDWATAGLFLFTITSASLAVFEFPPRYWVPPAILAVVAFILRGYLELMILKEIGGQ